MMSTAAVTVAGGATLVADALTCDMAQYKSSAGLTAAVDQNVLTVAWTGQSGSEMRARYTIDGGQPTVRELAVRRAGGSWVTPRQGTSPSVSGSFPVEKGSSVNLRDPLNGAMVPYRLARLRADIRAVRRSSMP